MFAGKILILSQVTHTLHYEMKSNSQDPSLEIKDQNTKSMSIPGLCLKSQTFFLWLWSRWGTGRRNGAEESMPRGRCVRVEPVHCQQLLILPLYFIHSGLFTFIATHGEVHFLSLVKYTICARQPQIRCTCHHVFQLEYGECCFGRRSFVQIARKPQDSLLFREVKAKKKSSISATFLFTETDRELSHLDWRLFFLLFLSFTTRNLSKTQMASEVKPQIKDYLLIYQKYQQTGKRKQNPKQIGHSKSMYTYTLRKELSVELGRRGERKTSGS